MSSTARAPVATPAGSPRWRRRLWRIGLSAAAILAVGLFVGAGCAVTCRPTWYAPQAVDYARLPDDKRAIVGIVDGIGDALHGSRSFTVDLSADQVNRWIVARKELSPEEWLDAKLPDLGDSPIPFVSFMPDSRVRLAVLADAGGFGSVASVVVRVRVTPTEVLLALNEVRLGYLKVPRSWVAELVRRFADGRIREVLEADGTWRVVNDFEWPNGKRRFRIGSFVTADNRATLELVGLGDGP